jgi:all-trans-retinol 13,14-reductase
MKILELMFLQGTFDAVIIGGGPSGLFTGALLARLNWRVCILEKNEAIGGGLHTFNSGGFEFETGLHYVGFKSPAIALLELITHQPIKWMQKGHWKNGYIYDCISIDGEKLCLPAGKKAWLEVFQGKFPECTDNIIRYMSELDKVNHWHISLYFKLKVLKVPKYISVWLQKKFCSTFWEITNITVKDKLQQLGIEPSSKLYSFLCSQYGNYGMIPSEAPFFIHAAVVMHYMEGGCFPVEGSGEIVRQLVPVIEECRWNSKSASNCHRSTDVTIWI